MRVGAKRVRLFTLACAGEELTQFRRMKIIPNPTQIRAAGNKTKLIEEYIGRVSSDTAQVSIARMLSPGGWLEPAQIPEFDEYTVVLRGVLRVHTKGGVTDVAAGQAVIAPKGEWVQYSTPAPEGAEYIAVCLPAFAPEIVHRESATWD
jgi:mannose-6-phosphate isomerase-like protein (cupin superfamily)